MDPITSCTVASELAGTFVNVIKLIKSIIETMKGTKKALVELLNRSERMRLILELFRSFTKRLHEPNQKTMTLTFNDGACRETVNELYGLVRKVAQAAQYSDLWMKFNWVLYKTEATKMIEKLEARERDLDSVLMFIAAQSSTTTQTEVSQLRAQVEEQARVVEPFSSTPAFVLGHTIRGDESVPQELPDDIKVVDGNQTNITKSSMAVNTTIARLWPGNTVRTDYSSTYLRERDNLSNSAYVGNWDGVFKSLDIGRVFFHQDWSNAARLRPSTEAYMVSGWTPLHQAGYTGAPIEVVQKLLDLGSSRTMPTCSTRNEFRFPDMTAGEIARELGFSYLSNILVPVIRHYIPARILLDLQDKLHSLIRKDLDDEAIPIEYLRLPELIVLTELQEPEMWFPIQTKTNQGRGFMIRIDGRELLVLSIAGAGKASRRLFRVTVTGWSTIEDAVVFHS